MSKVTSVGCMIWVTELLASSKPMRIMAIATASPDRYSILPWPNGCSLSGFCPESLKPIRVTIDEPASDRLLKASAVMATDEVRMPAKNFSAKRRKLASTPAAPPISPYFCLCAWSVILTRPSPAAIADKIFVIETPP